MLGSLGFGLTFSDFGDLIGPLVSVAWVPVAIAGIAWFAVSHWANEKTERHRREMLHQERMAAIEKGMTDALEHAIASEASDARWRSRPHDPRGLLVGGIVTTGAGVGISVFMWLVSADDRGAVGVGFIPLFVGLALIVAWLVTRRPIPNGKQEDLQRRS